MPVMHYQFGHHDNQMVPQLNGQRQQNSRDNLVPANPYLNAGVFSLDASWVYFLQQF